MSKLIDIAKECGAEIEEISGVQPPSLIKVEMTEDQLRATVEQVAGPLVEALRKAERLHLLSDEFIRGQIFSKRTALLGLRNSLAAYTEIIGDKK